MIDNRNKGLTLVELLVAIVISSLIVTAGVALHIANQRIFVTEGAVMQMRNDVRGALEIIISDLRLAGFNPSQAASPAFDPPINGASDHWVSMAMDINENGSRDSTDWLEYMLSGTDLMRHVTVLKTDELVGENIDYIDFRFYDADAVELVKPVTGAALEEIRAVKVLIIGKTPREFSNHHESGTYPDGSSFNDRCYRCWDSTYVKIRNI
jgi:type IV pilus assembly protein PilW